MMRYSIPAALLIGFAITGCRSRPAPVTPIPAAARPESVTPARPAPAFNADSARRASERENAARAERERLAREARAREMQVLTLPVYFEFDRSDLPEATRLVLDAKLQILRTDATTRIRVDGHADDRGSGEYNLGLSHRRAAAVRRYLVQREIAPDRIEIASYGEERPVCGRSEEECWRLNRRAEISVVVP